MARASTPTLLSLDRFAKLIALNPVHFSGAVGSMVWPANGACEDIWPQYSWQTSHELVGREEVAQTIATVEEDIKNALRYSPALTWEVDEDHDWAYANSRPRVQSMQTEYGFVKAPGKRAVTLIDADAAVVYSDPDNDGWDERVTITVTTDITDIRQIKVYYAGHDGDPEWEIRPLRSIAVSGGVATILADAWLFIDPDLWEEYPNISTPFSGIDITISANFVDAVDVYREYNDTTLAGVTFYSGGNGYSCYCGGAGCDICGGNSYGGCFSIRDSRRGIINPFPASYSDGNWSWYYPPDCTPAHRMTLSYYAGAQDKGYARGTSLDPLSLYMAEAITWMTAARLPASVCNCNNVRDTIERLQKDASTIRDGAQQSPLYARFEKQSMFSSPMGHRWGEVMAWERVNKLMDVVGSGGAL